MWKSTLFLALSVCLMFTMNFESVNALASQRYKKDNDFLPFLMFMMMMNNNNNNQKQQPQVIYAQPSFVGLGKGMIGGYGYGGY
ncbi:hypothetical protein ScPMuIL_004794 [Solemya velum]